MNPSSLAANVRKLYMFKFDKIEANIIGRKILKFSYQCKLEKFTCVLKYKNN